MKIEPPKIFSRLLRLVPRHLSEELDGDLLHRFDRDVPKYGLRRAQWRFLWNVTCCLRPGILFRRRPPQPTTFMINSYITIAIRNLLAGKMRSVIGILSLVVGLSCMLVMLSMAQFERSFDQFHSRSARTYRINRLVATPQGAQLQSGLPGPTATMIKSRVASIERSTAVQYYGAVQIDIPHGQEVRRFKEMSGAAFVDADFFEIFDFAGTSFRWISGEPHQALEEPFQVVLTESMAKKYFGDESPLGKTIVLEAQAECLITGVITDLPDHSDFPFQVLISYATLYEIEGERMRDDWRSVNHDNQVFVVLPEGSVPQETEDQFDRVHASLVDAALAAEQKFRLQPLAQLHRDSELGNFRHRTMSSEAIAIMMLVGTLLLVVGCINYINLATATATLRAREIGVRKVLGSGRRQLIVQFITEAFLVVITSAFLALVVAEIVLLQFTSITMIRQPLELITDLNMWVWIVVLVIVVTLLAGIYPAVVISKFGILGALKGLNHRGQGGVAFRRTLVVVQFATTQAFLIGAGVVLFQLNHSQSRDVGFQKDWVITAAIDPSNQSQSNVLASLLVSSSSVERVSFSSSSPSGYSRNHWFVSIRQRALPNQPLVDTEYQSVDTAYFGLYQIPIIRGRNFVLADTAGNAIINETLAASLGFRSLDDAIGQVVMEDQKERVIVGVVKDFMNNSSRERVGNMLFVVKPNFFMTANIKVRREQNDLLAVITSLEEKWHLAFPNIVFDYKFLDENIARMYEQERRLSTMLQFFAWVFLLLSCVGLYGMLSFVVNRKLKELAIRKIFGARQWQIMTLVSREYAILIVVAFLIAVPVSYWVMNQWLQAYADRVDIEWWILVTPMVIVLVVASATLMGQLRRAATRNPADTLRSE